MSEKIYRFVCSDAGIYEAVEKYCPKNDERRLAKPDGSWLPKVGEEYPGAISFWTEKGLNKYKNSGLRDWHYSVVNGQAKLLIAEKPESCRYQDDYQVICDKSKVTIKKEIKFKYEGPRPAVACKLDERPELIRHHRTVRDWNAYCSYLGSDETFTLVASVGKDLGLKKLGIHHEILNPNKRSSWPHAHKVEEELVFIIKGSPDIWINGNTYRAKPGDAVFFPPGSNLAHTLINNTNDVVEMMVLGEQEAKDDLIYYPMHPKRNSECQEGGYLWVVRPEVSMGAHDGKPSGDLSRDRGRWEFQVNWVDVEEKLVEGSEDESKVFYKTRDLGRFLGAKRIALHKQVLPSGFRSSLPHAESLEEEFVHILKGSPIVWINGSRYQLDEGDSVAFPSGTGIAHTFINESGEDVDLLVVGETTKAENKCFFPVNLEEKDRCQIWWEGAPLHEMGGDSPYPLDRDG